MPQRHFLTIDEYKAKRTGHRDGEFFVQMIWIIWTSRCVLKNTVRSIIFFCKWLVSQLAGHLQQYHKANLMQIIGTSQCNPWKEDNLVQCFLCKWLGPCRIIDCQLSGKKGGYLLPNLSIKLQSIWNVLECDRRLHTWGGGDLQQISTSWRQKVPTVIARERCDGQHWHPSNLCCHIGHIFSHWSNRSQR